MKKLILVLLIVVSLFSVSSAKAQSVCDTKGPSISAVLDIMSQQGLTLDLNPADKNLFSGTYDQNPVSVSVKGTVAYSFGGSTNIVLLDGCPIAVSSKNWPDGQGPFVFDGMVSGSLVVIYNSGAIDLPFIDDAIVSVISNNPTT